MSVSRDRWKCGNISGLLLFKNEFGAQKQCTWFEPHTQLQHTQLAIRYKHCQEYVSLFGRRSLHMQQFTLAYGSSTDAFFYHGGYFAMRFYWPIPRPQSPLQKKTLVTRCNEKLSEKLTPGRPNQGLFCTMWGLQILTVTAHPFRVNVHWTCAMISPSYHPSGFHIGRGTAIQKAALNRAVGTQLRQDP